MTAPREFGAAIEVNGERPSWLPDDVQIQACDSDGVWDGTISKCFAHHFVWQYVTAIRLERPRYDFVYLALERGMVPWFGGDEAPGDWDGGYVYLADDTILAPSHIDDWEGNHDGYDIIGYTRKATTTALPLAHPAAPQGEEGAKADPRVLDNEISTTVRFTRHPVGKHGSYALTPHFSFLTETTPDEAIDIVLKMKVAFEDELAGSAGCRLHQGEVILGAAHPAAPQGEDSEVQRLRAALRECREAVSHGSWEPRRNVREIVDRALEVADRTALAPAEIASGREGAEQPSVYSPYVDGRFVP